MDIKNLNAKNTIVKGAYSDYGRYSETGIAVFKYDEVIAVTYSNHKTVTKKEKEMAKEYKLSMVKVKTRKTGTIKVTTEEGYKTIDKFENEVSYNNNVLFCITTYEKEFKLF